MVGMVAGHAVVQRLPSGKCLAPASPGATSRFGGRSPDCSCCPLRGGSQRLTLWQQTERASDGGGLGVVRGRGVPRKMWLQAPGTGWAQARGAAQPPPAHSAAPGHTERAQRRGPRVELSRCPWIRPDGRANRLCPLSRRGRSSGLPPHLQVLFFFLN